MRKYRRELAKYGHDVTSRWIDSSGDGMREADIADDPERAEYLAVHGLRDVRSADIVVVFTETDSTTGGYHVEMGFALGIGRRVVIIGEPKNIFQTIGAFGHFPTWDEFCKSEGIR